MYNDDHLTEEQYRVARQNGTEPPFSGEYIDFKEKGKFKCICCGAILFISDAKYDSQSGWPSFTDPAFKNAVKYLEDKSHGMHRVEVRCNTCDAHLGHVFPDGPGESSKRYCINSCVLDFENEFKV